MLCNYFELCKHVFAAWLTASVGGIFPEPSKGNPKSKCSITWRGETPKDDTKPSAEDKEKQHEHIFTTRGRDWMQMIYMPILFVTLYSWTFLGVTAVAFLEVQFTGGNPNQGLCLRLPSRSEDIHNARLLVVEGHVPLKHDWCKHGEA